MTYAPIARIVLRYVVGGVLGYAAFADQAIADPDILMLVSGAIGVAVEAAYAYAKRRGWAT
jgi:hypothetical protein